MKIIIQSYSTIGAVRPQNEDAIEYINNLSNTSTPNENKLLYASLFDGHGGGIISKTLVEKINIKKYFCSSTSPLAKINQSSSYNKKLIVPLFKRIQEKLKNDHISSNTMGSTALIALIFPKNEKKNKYALKIINLGDSRSVICTGYDIDNQLTIDHKPFERNELQRITGLGGKLEREENDDIRINGMSVSRAFGDFDNKYISQIPDVFDYNLSTEKFLILGCDGVWDVLKNKEAVEFILDNLNTMNASKIKLVNMKGKSEHNLASKLADFAIKKGSTDNISVTIIFFTDNL